MSADNPERPITANFTGGFASYREVAEHVLVRLDTGFNVTRDITMRAYGGLVLGAEGSQLLYVSDGVREYQRPRGGMDKGPVSFQVDPDEKYTAPGNLIAHVEPWENDLLDRGLAWLRLPRNELAVPRFSVGITPRFSVRDAGEIAERLSNAEINAVAMLEDMLDGTEQPRYSGDFPVAV